MRKYIVNKFKNPYLYRLNEENGPVAQPGRAADIYDPSPLLL
ncbi:MAG: hypothetical protein QW607_00200 [Desulfurococcaceae archaeon]